MYLCVCLYVCLFVSMYALYVGRKLTHVLHRSQSIIFHLLSIGWAYHVGLVANCMVNIYVNVIFSIRSYYCVL